MSHPTTNGWTGGQYSLWRWLLSVAVVAECGLLSTEPGPSRWAWLAVPAAVPLALGVFDRVAAGLLLVSLAIAGWWLIPVRDAWPLAAALWLHLVMPPAPFGSVAARARTDPAGDWRMPTGVRVLAWGLLIAAVVTALASLTRQAGREGVPVQAPWNAAMCRITIGLGLVLCAWRGSRRIGWLLLVAGWPACWIAGVPVGVMVATLPLLALAFNPAWIPPVAAPPDWLFYDGGCGLCHRCVRLVLAEDASGSAFRFAPLAGLVFETHLDERWRNELPDSIVVLDTSGLPLVRTAAVIRIGLRLGGIYSAAARLVQAIPPRIADFGYDVVARIRYRLFARPKDVCPVLPERLRTRFELD